MTETLLVEGSHGRLVVDAHTGDVLEYQIECGETDKLCSPCGYRDVIRVDLGPLPRDKDYDILSVGLFLRDGTYDSPEIELEVITCIIPKR